MRPNQIVGCLLKAAGRAGKVVTVCVYTQNGMESLTGGLYAKARDAFESGNTIVELDQMTDPGNPVLVVEKGNKILRMPVNKSFAYVNDELAALGGVVLCNGRNIYVPQRTVDLLSE